MQSSVSSRFHSFGKGSSFMMVAVIVGLVSLLIVTGTAAAQTTYSLTDLGVLPGDTLSGGTAINDSGQVVANGEFGRSFFWDAGLVTEIIAIDGHPARARDLNNMGEVVGTTFNDNGDIRAFLWDAGIAIDLGNLIGGQPNTEARGINNNSQVVGNGSFLGGEEGFLWENGILSGIGFLPGGSFQSSAAAINDIGNIVGESNTPIGIEPFILTAGGMTQIGHLPGGVDFTSPSDLNNSDQVVGSSTVASGRRGFLWEAGAMIDLGALVAGDSSFAIAINEAGQIVGRSGPFGQSDSAAFLWDDVNGMVDINTLLDTTGNGWAVTSAGDINHSGQIAATAISPLEEIRAVLLSPVPEPTSAGMLAAGLLGLVAFNSRRSSHPAEPQ